MRARARDRLLRLADYLGATVYCEGQQWYILHYGVGDIIEDPVAHSSWGCLGRLLHVATAVEHMGGHGYSFEELQAVVRCPWQATWVDRRVVMVLPSGIDGPTDAMLSRLVKDEFQTAYELEEL